jgi:DNA-binding NarL/FixJ family response regulator
MTDPSGIGRRTRVLVVQAEALLRELIALEAEEVGCEVACAASGGAALDALTAAAHHVVLVDARIGSPDLATFLSAARAARPDARFVALVPFHDGAALETALSLAPFACLELPFTVEELGDVIRLACADSDGG